MGRLLKPRVGWIVLLLAAIWVVEGIQWLTGRWLNTLFGLVPRNFRSLDGVVAMPILHASPAHAGINTPPLVFMGALLVVAARRNLAAVNAVIVIGGGIAVWLLGAPHIHIGANGLVFGWFGFLVARGLINRTWLTLAAAAIAAAIVIAFIHGGLAWGIPPGQARIIWEAQIFGALAGMAAAWLVPASNSRRSDHQ